MKTLLICPTHRPAVARLADTAPLVLIPILGQSLVEYWIEHLVNRGEREARIIATDRPAQIRELVGDGARWGLQLDVCEHVPPEARVQNDTAPDNVVIMDHLPGLAKAPLFESYAAWFDALQAWMPHAVAMERIGRRQLAPGVSIGLHARIAPSAQLSAPCWIGDHAVIGADAVIGPGAIVEDLAVVGAGACVTQSVIGRETFVGEHTLVERSIACGNLLINWENRSCLEVPDPFLLSSLAHPPVTPPRVSAPAKSSVVTLRNLIPGQQS